MNLAFRIYEVDDDTGLDLYNGYFSRPLGEIWTERGVKPPKDDDRAGAAKLILDTVVEKDDKCAAIWSQRTYVHHLPDCRAGSQCATGGLALFTEASASSSLPSRNNTNAL